MSTPSLEPQTGAPIVQQPPANSNMADYNPMPPTRPNQYASTLLQLMSEFVSGGSVSYLSALKRTLPQYIDALTMELGADLYERMMRDPDVYTAVDVRKNQILSEGMRIEVAVQKRKSADKPDPKRDADAEKSQEIADFLAACVKALPRHHLAVSYELLDALFLGNKVAELILDRVPPHVPQWQGKVWWRGIKMRNRRKLAWILDSWNNIVGFFAVEPDKAYVTIPTITIIDNPEDYANFLPADKFVAYVHRPKDEDPRGTSLLEAAYPAWIFKTQILPQYFNNLRRHGGGTLIGHTDPNGAALVPQNDPVTGEVLDNLPQITKEQALLQVLISATDQSAVVVPGNTVVEFAQPDGHGEAFLNAFRLCREWIHQAILGTARTTLEATNNSAADNDAAGDVTSQSGNLYKQELGWLWTNQIFLPLVKLNYPQYVHLCPDATFVKVERQDKADLVAAYAQAGYSLDETQFQGIDDELDMPARDMEAIKARKQQEQDALMMQTKLSAAAYNPAGGGSDDEDEEPAPPPKAKKAA